MMSPESTRWNRLTFLLLGVLTLLRLPLLSAIEFSPDEAYYWDWSRRLALGYYDQGPLIAYLIRLTTTLFGTTEFGVRIGVLLCCLGAVGCCVWLAVRIFSPRAGFLTALFLSATPLMTVGSLIATYDPPLVFFWALTLCFLHNALFSEGAKQQNRSWILAGAAAGLGFLAKHTLLLIAPCLIVFLLWSPPHRKWLFRPQPYAAFLLCLLLYAGVFYWNVHHHWWTFRHLLFLAGKTPGSFPKRFGDFLGSQALLLGPVLFLGSLFACRRTPNLHRPAPLASAPDAQRLFLICMGLPVFLFFCGLTLKSKVQGNWGPFAWLSLTVLFAGRLSEQWGKSPVRKTAWAVLGTSVFLTLALLLPGLRTALGIRISPDVDLSNTAYGWREMARHVQTLREKASQKGRPLFLAGNGYQFPALMAFYLPDHPQTFDLFLNYRLTMYAASVEDLKAHLGEDCLWINENQVEDPLLRRIFTRVEWQTPIPIWRRPYSDTPIRTLFIARCFGYRLYTGLAWAKGG